MALWPFRARGTDKRSGAAMSAAENPPARDMAKPAPARLSRSAPRYSFSPDRQDAIHVDPSQGPQDGPLAEQNASAQNHIPEARVPTLHHNRAENQPSRRKSSKRKRQDHTREAEIKAMSALTPARATTDTLATARSFKHDNKRAKTLPATVPWDSPASDTSLPFTIPVPVPVAPRLSSDSHYSSYRVTALDALAPRPTLRYQGSVRMLPPRTPAPAPSGSQKKRLGTFDEETLRAHKRIDDLADGFDAGELRELMERDARRREKHRQRERDKAERRLARKAEKQKREETAARETGTPPPENLERGVMGREVGLGIDPPSTVVTSSKQRSSPEPMSGVEGHSQKPRGDLPTEPLGTFHRVDTAPREVESTPAPANPPQAARKSEEHAPAVPPVIRLEGSFMPKTSTSGSTFDSDKDKTSSAMDDDAATRKDSEASSKTNRLSFSALIRWGRGRRSSGGPSSFSNTSREEMSAAAAAAAAAHAQTQARSADSPVPSLAGNYLSSKPGSGPPKRMRSRFREDLPELPLSPPESRVQSPEANASLPSVAEYQSAGAGPTQTPTLRDDTPTSGHRSIDIPQTRASRDRMYGGGHSAEPHLSMSLASVDSEASWLSGRVGSQMSQRMSSIRDRVRSRQQGHDRRSDSPTNSAHDDLEITEDDYMSRLSPDPTILTFNTRLSGEGRPSSDGDDLMDEGEVRWGAVGAQPQFVSSHTHNRDTVRSREGLLNIDSGDEEDLDRPISPISPISQVAPSIEGKADLQRATSVRMDPAHARNFSPGSAKLLEIHHPQASTTDGKRGNQERPNGA
ncbi:hypothetical protein Trco_001748 [Trichoderma cornu-damae]|uniref:Uncharacterized protein n=1 Tax=Trichoderma cornu-damae TaxID=654480 RepID=A0A9P8QTM5_9HYPO|nr:hypothetical protein Trco_001748 [Trichoderma cornu-damae]